MAWHCIGPVMASQMARRPRRGIWVERATRELDRCRRSHEPTGSSAPSVANGGHRCGSPNCGCRIAGVRLPADRQAAAPPCTRRRAHAAPVPSAGARLRGQRHRRRHPRAIRLCLTGEMKHSLPACMICTSHRLPSAAFATLQENSDHARASRGTLRVRKQFRQQHLRAAAQASCTPALDETTRAGTRPRNCSLAEGMMPGCGRLGLIEQPCAQSATPAVPLQHASYLG
jgi:hypothetical protein